jgi:hypothetical protein
MAEFDEDAEVQKCKQYLLGKISGEERPTDPADCYHYASAYSILVNAEIAKGKPKIVEPNEHD